MKKRIISLVLLGISVLTVTACAALQAQSQRMAEKIIRLHVVANSDSDADQSVKLRVRDAVLREAQNVLSDASDASCSQRATMTRFRCRPACISRCA